MGCVQGKGGRVLSTHPRPSSPSCLPSLPPPPLSQVKLQAQQVGVAEAPAAAPATATTDSAAADGEAVVNTVPNKQGALAGGEGELRRLAGRLSSACCSTR